MMNMGGLAALKWSGSVFSTAVSFGSRRWLSATVASVDVKGSSSRKLEFSTVTEDDVGQFRSFLSSGGIVQDVDDMKSYNCDWMNKYKGESKLALRPKTTAEVSEVLRYCNERHIAVVPQGGNTGLVGGSVPVHDEVSNTRLTNPSQLPSPFRFESSTRTAAIELPEVIVTELRSVHSFSCFCFLRLLLQRLCFRSFCR